MVGDRRDEMKSILSWVKWIKLKLTIKQINI